MYKLEFIGRIVNAWPGKKYFGIYRFLPGFFVLGGLIEFTMIHLRVGEINFYDIYKRKRQEEWLRQQSSTVGGGKSLPPVLKDTNPNARSYLENYEAYLNSKTRST